MGCSASILGQSGCDSHCLLQLPNAIISPRRSDAAPLLETVPAKSASTRIHTARWHTILQLTALASSFCRGFSRKYVLTIVPTHRVCFHQEKKSEKLQVGARDKAARSEAAEGLASERATNEFPSRTTARGTLGNKHSQSVRWMKPYESTRERTYQKSLFPSKSILCRALRA